MNECSVCSVVQCSAVRYGAVRCGVAQTKSEGQNIRGTFEYKQVHTSCIRGCRTKMAHPLSRPFNRGRL